MSTKADLFKERHKRFDPHFNDIPYEIIKHDGKTIGEVYKLPTEQLYEGRVKRMVRE